MLAAVVAELVQLQPLAFCLLVLRGRVVPVLTVVALQGDNLSRHP